MVTIDINSISNAKLKQLATEIDNSNVSAKDNKIDNNEFGIFKQRAKAELLDKKQITNDDYKAIFGLEKTNINIKTSNSKSTSTTPQAQKQEKIKNLKKDITDLRTKLYKGKYEEIAKKNYRTNSTAQIVGIGAGIMGMFTAAELELGHLAAAACFGSGILIGAGIILGGAYLIHKFSGKSTIYEDKKYMQQCQQQNPKLYQKLKEAEKQLAELQE